MLSVCPSTLRTQAGFFVITPAISLSTASDSGLIVAFAKSK